MIRLFDVYISWNGTFYNKPRYDNFSVAKILMTRQVRYGYPTKTDRCDSCGFCHKLGSKLIPCTPNLVIVQNSGLVVITQQEMNISDKSFSC